MAVSAFDSKKASEAVLLSFSFIHSLDPQELILEGSIISVRVVSGADPAPLGILMGEAGIVGAEVRQWVQGGAAGAVYELTARIVTDAGQTLEQSGTLPIDAAPPVRSLLFDRASIIPALRNDRLMMALQGALPQIELSDDYLWAKLLAAEKEAERALRVFLTPVELLPEGTAQSVADGLTSAGVRWQWEPNYDFYPDMFIGDSWGMIKLRYRPLISVSSVVMAYPAPLATVFTMPAEWLRQDREAGVIQMVPSTQYYSVAVPPYFLNVLATGRMIPQMIRVRYRAGLSNALADYPDLADLVLKMAVHSLVEDAFLPQSGSISADGLSQSLSVDLGKYAETIERRAEALRQAIHGIRMMVV